MSGPRRLRVLLDANVLVAAYAARGACAELLRHCLERHDLVSTPGILGELERGLRDKVGLTAAETAERVDLVRKRSRVEAPEGALPEFAPDPGDRHVLAAIRHFRPDAFVTGDKALLKLAAFEGVPILSPRGFWEGETGLL